MFGKLSFDKDSSDFFGMANEVYNGRGLNTSFANEETSLFSEDEDPMEEDSLTEMNEAPCSQNSPKETRPASASLSFLINNFPSTANQPSLIAAQFTQNWEQIKLISTPPSPIYNPKTNLHSTFSSPFPQNPPQTKQPSTIPLNSYPPSSFPPYQQPSVFPTQKKTAPVFIDLTEEPVLLTQNQYPSSLFPLKELNDTPQSSTSTPSFRNQTSNQQTDHSSKAKQRGKRLLRQFRTSRPALEDQIFRTLHTFYQTTHKYNALLMGPSGCGKEAIFLNIVLKYEKTTSKNMHIKICNGIQIVQTKNSSEIEPLILNKINNLFSDAQKKSQDEVIILIKNIHALFINQNISMHKIFEKNLIEFPKIQVVGTTTPLKHREILQKHDIFSRIFRTIHIESMDEATTLEVLKQRYGETFDTHFYQEVWRCSHSYLPEEGNPRKSIDLIKECEEVAFQKKISIRNALQEVIKAKTSFVSKLSNG